MINSFVLSAIKESYYLNNNMKEISFKEYLENEAENEPNFFYELFENEDYEQNWDSVLSEEDREEWNNLLNKANDNVSSTNLEQSKLCVNSPLYIDTRLFGEQAIGCNSA